MIRAMFGAALFGCSVYIVSGDVARAGGSTVAFIVGYCFAHMGDEVKS